MSLLLRPSVKKDTTIKVFDDHDGDHSSTCCGITDYYGWTEITVHKDLDDSICLSTFEKDSTGAHVDRNFHNISEDLDGDVSFIKIFH